MDTSTILAADIMTQRLSLTTPETHVMDAIERLIAQHVSGLPVINSAGKFVGRFSERTAIAALDLAVDSAMSRARADLSDVHAADIMQRNCLQLDSSQDVFDSATNLLSRKVSGAPVVDRDGTLRGVFSEESVMHVFIGLCWEQLPSSSVTAWLDRHDDRRITEETPLADILDRFQQTPYRRLMVLHGTKFVGQITRQDALRAALAQSREPLATSRHLPGEQQMGLRTTVAGWMQSDAATIQRDADVLSIARKFLQTAARQLAVVEGDRLEGQISRSDLLRAIQRFFPSQSSGDSVQPLYISSTNKRDAYSVVK